MKKNIAVSLNQTLTDVYPSVLMTYFSFYTVWINKRKKWDRAKKKKKKRGAEINLGIKIVSSIPIWILLKASAIKCRCLPESLCK